MVHSDKILLVYPGAKAAKPRLPMSILALGTHLAANGMDCGVVDERVSELTDEAIVSAGIIGISSMSGIQLKAAIATAERIKKLNPRAPVIWGGAHATFCPVQTAQSGLADIVVKGEGEEVFLELCRKILAQEDYCGVPSITCTCKGTIQDNARRDGFMDMEALHYPLYSLFDLKKYADHTEGLSYESSRGCAHRCAFCYVDHFHKPILFIDNQISSNQNPL
ncbi:MAG: cobalamin-dependent protein [Planctomycetota bacterium]